MSIGKYKQSVGSLIGGYIVFEGNMTQGVISDPRLTCYQEDLLFIPDRVNRIFESCF